MPDGVRGGAIEQRSPLLFLCRQTSKIDYMVPAGPFKITERSGRRNPVGPRRGRVAVGPVVGAALVGATTRSRARRPEHAVATPRRGDENAPHPEPSPVAVEMLRPL